jgi:hypothetical protein
VAVSHAQATRTVAAGGMLAVAALAGSVAYAARAASAETSTALVVIPLLMVATLPAVIRQARREGDRSVAVFLLVMLALKLAATLVRYHVTFEVYERADAAGYDERGLLISRLLLDGDLGNPAIGPLHGTNFVSVVTGVVYALVGPSRLAGFFVFSWLGFLGMLLFYRAFRVAVPAGRGRGYARLLFLLPSVVYWPSSIGKEAWMLFALGLASYGAARTLVAGWRGLPAFAAGAWLAALVRPHVAGMAALALVAAALLRRPRAELRHVAPVAKLATVAVLAAAAALLVGQAGRFLEDSGVPTDAGIRAALETISERTAAGGSEFAPSVVESPLRAPLGAFTVLFRPTLLEASNAQALATALEATFLLGLVAIRGRWLVAAFRSARRSPYLAYAGVFVGLFVVAYSGVANFGLLARQRTQVLPFLLVLLAVPPPDREAPPAPSEVARGEA